MISIYQAKASGYGQDIYFSWKLSGDCGQCNYQIVVRDADGAVAWDSGVVQDKNRHNIKCQAKLEAENIYTLTVMCEGTDGSKTSATGNTFCTEISKWVGQWIEPARTRRPITDSKNPMEPITEVDPLERLDPAVYFRGTLNLSEKNTGRKLLYVTAHGIYDFLINGKLVSSLLAPGYTSYGKRLEYQCIDVTDYLHVGENVIVAIVADGWYTGKMGAVGYGQQYGTESGLLFQLVERDSNKASDSLTDMEAGNGTDRAADKKLTKVIMTSGPDMKWTTGAYQYADLFVGEYYDQSLEPTGLSDITVDDGTWQSVRVADYGYENLTLQGIPEVREARTIVPTLLHTPDGELVLDAGETVVGYVSFDTELQANQIVSMEHSETLTREGNFLQNIIGHNKDQKDFYRAAETGRHSYKPHFTYHGFRYVRLEGFENIDENNFLIHVLETPKDKTGTFYTSDERLNKLHENIIRSQNGNMICIPTDCPQREKTGWTGDMQVYAPTACYEQDVEQFLRHWLVDMRHEQLPDGQIPHIIPYFPSHDYMKPEGIDGVSAAGWSDAAVIIPWRLYEAYGDKEILRENFHMMHSYMTSVRQLMEEIPKEVKESCADPKILGRNRYLWNTGFQYGDWLMPSIQMSGRPIFEVVIQTGHIVATMMTAITTGIMEKVCAALGMPELEAEYADFKGKISQAFRDEYVLPDGKIKKDFQGIYVLALASGVLTEEQEPIATERLAQLIHENGDLLDTGFLSVAYLLPMLSAHGRKELANKILFSERCPSWLYEVKMGATTMWEYWNGYAPDGTPEDGSMNHFAFGCVGEYLYRSILGIEGLEPGFSKVRIAPDFFCGLDEVSGSYDSVWGKISVHWKRVDRQINMEITLPPDVKAEVLNGNPELEQINSNHDIYIISEIENGANINLLGAGKYKLEYTLGGK